jgi:hypothetical protein
VRKIIYIAGCGHSGSTVLEMLLTTTGKAVGLGEVWNIVDESPERTRRRLCSCGARAPDCGFWAPVMERMGALGGDASRAERYRCVLDQVEHLFGPDVAVIDSSKKARHLTALTTEVPGVDLAVLHNIRDVRPYTISMLDAYKRKGLGRVLPEAVFCHWYQVNRALQTTAVQVLGAPPVQVMHESLCLATDMVARRLAQALGAQYIDPRAALNSGTVHNINGNRLRVPRRARRARTLVYGYHWLMRAEWLRPYVLLPMVRRYNERCLRQSYGLHT